MIVIVLSVTPEKLRGELTRWLLEISAGVYVGHLPARVRDLLWLRVIEDVGRGRALMVWTRRGEQRLDFRAHNHPWEVVDNEGLTLMRRQTAKSRELAAGAPDATVDDGDGPRGGRRGWSKAARRRKYGTTVEQRRREQRFDESAPE